jgi:hypothetical protein
VHNNKEQVLLNKAKQASNKEEAVLKELATANKKYFLQKI